MYLQDFKIRIYYLYVKSTLLSKKFICFLNFIYGRLKFESGSHRVQRVPKTESQGRIHTSTATVLVTPEVEAEDFDIDMNDLEIETMRSSGAGGQHINKTDSAVRIVHKPTGIVVKCQDGRSQHENRATALMTIRSRVYEEHQRKLEEEQGMERRSKIGTGDRAEKIRSDGEIVPLPRLSRNTSTPLMWAATP